MNVGQAARDAGVPTLTAFLSEETGRQVREEHGPADLVAANNVYAHIPDVIGFTKGLRALVADDGWVSIEVQHLLTLIEKNQYDTIYHEHFQYYTVESARRALATGGLTVVDVELVPTHGGSIRLWARPDAVAGEPSERMTDVLEREKAAGLHELSGYTEFAERVTARAAGPAEVPHRGAQRREDRRRLRRPGQGQHPAQPLRHPDGPAAYTVDRNPYKHGRFTPGTRIPVLPPERIEADRPDYVLVLPWNLREELTEQLSFVGAWGGKLVFPIPRLEIVEVQ